MTVPTLAAPDRARAGDLARRFSSARVLVVGDVMLDQFLIGRVSRISPEAPVPIVQFEREENRIGGAANVAHNIAALGGAVDLVGLVGRDTAAAILARELAAQEIPTAGLVDDPSRPTTMKVRVVTDRHQQVARVDYERDEEASEDVEAALVERAKSLASGAGAIVVSDYLKGAVTRRLVASLVAVADAARDSRARRSEDPAPRLLRPRHSRHPEQPRGGGGDTSADSNERRREPGGRRVPRASRVQRGADHAR